MRNVLNPDQFLLLTLETYGKSGMTYRDLRRNFSDAGYKLDSGSFSELIKGQIEDDNITKDPFGWYELTPKGKTYINKQNA